VASCLPLTVDELFRFCLLSTFTTADALGTVSLSRRLIWPLRPDSDPEPSIHYVSVS
jgi:hypothetical protein